MVVVLKKVDFTKNGWQERRHKDLKDTGMGKALEAYKVHYNKGAAAVIQSGHIDDAIAKGAAVSKAIAKATRNLGAIKDAGEKKQNKQLLEAYEQEVAAFADQLLTAGYSIQCDAVVEEIERMYVNDAFPKLEKVRAKAKSAAEALKKSDVETAISEHGIALNALKGLTDYVTTNGVRKMIKNFAPKDVAPKDVNAGDPRIKASFSKLAGAYKDVQKVLGVIDNQIEKLEGQLADKEPETGNGSAEYKQNLKKLMGLYKDVVTSSHAGLAKVKKAHTDIPKLQAILAKTVAGNANALVGGVLKVHKRLGDEYRGIDAHIQQTIRTDKSVHNVQAKEWGITPDDKGKNTRPLMNRAFALNYQAKELFETGTDELIKVLEETVVKFDDASAKKALAVLQKDG